MEFDRDLPSGDIAGEALLLIRDLPECGSVADDSTSSLAFLVFSVSLQLLVMIACMALLFSAGVREVSLLMRLISFRIWSYKFHR